MFITSKNKYLSNDMKIFGTCSIYSIVTYSLHYELGRHLLKPQLHCADFRSRMSRAKQNKRENPCRNLWEPEVYSASSKRFCMCLHVPWSVPTILKFSTHSACSHTFNGPCGVHVVFIPGIQFSILNKLTFQVMWLQTRHPLHLYVRVAA